MKNHSRTIYLDNAASAPVLPEVIEFCRSSFAVDFANQEAIHLLAYDQRKKLEASANTLLALAPERHFSQLIWGDSATGLLRLAGNFLSGSVVASSHLEHPALPAALDKCDLHFFKNDHTGKLLPDSLICSDPAAVILHHVQSETGLIQDFAPLRARFANSFILADCAQSAGRLPLPVLVNGAIISGVKLGAPGGAALLLDNSKTADKLVAFARKERNAHRLSRIQPYLSHALALAATLQQAQMQQNLSRINILRTQMLQLLKECDIHPLLPETCATSPYITAINLPGIQSAVVVRALSERGIYTASGSACAAETDKPSPSLLALGLQEKAAFSILRVSFNASTTLEDVKIFVTELDSVLKNY